jgi:hypothetical protein
MLRFVFAVAAACCISFAASAEQFGPWEMADYGTVQITRKDTGLAVQVTAPPGGITLTRPSDPKQTYELVVSGEKMMGTPTLRLRMDEDGPQYLLAPQGETKITVSGHRAVEVMVYGDAPFQYRLTRVELRPCADCRTPKQKLAAAETVASGWKAELLGDPAVRGSDGGVVIDGIGGQRGIIFRRKLDPGKTYKLVVRGTPVEGEATLRVKIGTNEPEWLPAPTSETQITVQNAAEVETIIYAEKPFSYRLAGIELQVCPACRSQGTALPLKPKQ